MQHASSRFLWLSVYLALSVLTVVSAYVVARYAAAQAILAREQAFVDRVAPSLHRARQDMRLPPMRIASIEDVVASVMDPFSLLMPSSTASHSIGSDWLEADHRTVRASGISAMIAYHEFSRSRGYLADIGRDLSQWTDDDRAFLSRLAQERIGHLGSASVFLFGDYAFAVSAIKAGITDQTRRYGDSLIVHLPTGTYAVWMMSRS